MALSRCHSRFDAVRFLGGVQHWSRRALVPGRSSALTFPQRPGGQAVSNRASPTVVSKQKPVQQKSSRSRPREDFRVKGAVRLRARARGRRGGRLGLRRRRWRWGRGRGVGVRRIGFLGLFRGGGRVYDGGVVLSLLLSRRSWSNGFGFLLARSEEGGAGQNAD